MAKCLKNVKIWVKRIERTPICLRGKNYTCTKKQSFNSKFIEEIKILATYRHYMQENIVMNFSINIFVNNTIKDTSCILNFYVTLSWDVAYFILMVNFCCCFLSTMMLLDVTLCTLRRLHFIFANC